MKQLKNIGPKTHRWLLEMLNKCFIENKIPTIWRLSQNIVIRKHGKDSAIPKSYRLISLVCHTHNLFERMILNRIAPTIELHRIKDQAGFRLRKSFTSQLLKHIQDCYHEIMITGTTFVDLCVVKYTVHQRLLIM